MDRLVEHVDNSIQRLISGYTRAYLKTVVAANSYVDLKGLATRGEYTLTLGETFVQLDIDPQTVHNLSSHLLSSDEAPGRQSVIAKAAKVSKDQQSIWHWIKRARVERSALAIIGPPGSGKTTLLKNVAHILAVGGGSAYRKSAPGKIPVLIALRDHRNDFSGASAVPTLAGLIRGALKDVSKSEPPGWVEDRLHAGKFLLMLDGLDEMAEASARQQVCAWVDRQREAYPETTFIVTSRPFGYRENPLDVAIVVQVNPFTEEQVEGFLRKWYRATKIRSFGEANASALLAASEGYEDLIGQIKASPTLRNMAVNPLLATMIANVHHYRGALPNSRAELYSEVCEVFLGKRHIARGVPVDMTVGQKQTILQTLAYEMMERESRDISVDDASEVLSEVLARVAPDTDPSTFLRRAEESSGLVLERENGTYGFAHLTFQEYLAACHVRAKRLGDTLLVRLDQSWWRETILLYAAQADATDIIIACLKETTEDVSLLALAVECEAVGQEIGSVGRELLQRRIYPLEEESDQIARKMAGSLRLLRRAREFRRVSEGFNLSPTPITNSEYQVFLEMNPGHRPDHWDSDIYPAGSADSPILGVRHSDAREFCKWMREFLGDGMHYRLPAKLLSITSDTPGLLPDPKIFQPERFGLLAYWAGVDPIDLAYSPTIHSGGRLSVQIDGSVQQFDDFVEYLESHGSSDMSSMDFERLGVIVSRDLKVSINEIRSFIADERLRISRMSRPAPDGSYVMSDYYLDLGERLKVRLLDTLLRDEMGSVELLVEQLRSRNWQVLDVGRILQDTEDAVQSCYRLAPGSLSESDLLSLAQSLGFASSTALNRSNAAQITSASTSEGRAMTRWLAIACAGLCSEPELAVENDARVGSRLKDLRIGVSSSIAAFRTTAVRRTRRATITRSNSVGVLGTPAGRREYNMAQLRALLLSIAARLMVLEMRIEGRMAPVEGIVVVHSLRRPLDNVWIVRRASHGISGPQVSFLFNGPPARSRTHP